MSDQHGLRRVRSIGEYLVAPPGYQHWVHEPTVDLSRPAIEPDEHGQRAYWNRLPPFKVIPRVRCGRNGPVCKIIAFYQLVEEDDGMMLYPMAFMVRPLGEKAGAILTLTPDRSDYSVTFEPGAHRGSAQACVAWLDKHQDFLFPRGGGRPPGINSDPDPLFRKRFVKALRRRYDDGQGLTELPSRVEMAEDLGISPDTLDRRIETYHVSWPPMWPPE